jgi:hypothetical protein
MQMAYIPPIAHLKDVITRDFQLMLPQFVEDPEYKKHFLKARRLGKHIILDNGANEKKPCPPEELSTIAANFFVSEVVMPDVMGDFQATYDSAKVFLGEYKKSFRKEVAFGFVLHGRNYHDVCMNYNELRKNLFIFNQIGVIYLPRLLVSEQSPFTRIEAADYIFGQPKIDKRPHKPIHFLGASPYWPREAYQAFALADGPRKRIRSMDTSAPYVYALRNMFIDEGFTRRDEATYFDTTLDPGQHEMAVSNMNAMDRWAGKRVEEASVSEL